MLILNKEAVMPVKRRKLMILRIAEGYDGSLSVFWREKGIAVYAYHMTGRFDKGQSRDNSSSIAANIHAVEHFGKIPITVCIESVGKFLSLVSLVRCSPVGKHAVLILLGLGEIVSVKRTV